MPLGRADRLPPTASVVDAVFANLDLGEETGPSAWGSLSGVTNFIQRRRRAWTMPLRPPYIGIQGRKDYEWVYEAGANPEYVDMDDYGNHQDDALALYVGSYLASQFVDDLKEKELRNSYTGEEKRALTAHALSGCGSMCQRT